MLTTWTCEKIAFLFHLVRCIKKKFVEIAFEYYAIFSNINQLTHNDVALKVKEKYKIIYYDKSAFEFYTKMSQNRALFDKLELYRTKI